MNTPESESSRPGGSGLQVRLGAKSARRLRLVWLVLGFLTVVVLTGATLIGRSPTLAPVPSAVPQSSTQPRIAWSENQIEVILSPGENTFRDMTFTSSQSLSNVVIEPVGGEFQLCCKQHGPKLRSSDSAESESASPRRVHAGTAHRVAANRSTPTRDSEGPRRRRRQVTPLSASDTAHDSAPASDMN